MRGFVPNVPLRQNAGASSFSAPPPAAPEAAEPMEIFRAGTHVASSGQPHTITREMLKRTAAAYDPARHEAPLVVGHPKTDAPAYGWVKRLYVEGDSLFAEPDAVDEQFADLVRQRRYSKISSAFFHPTDETSPSPGIYALRHVGFLGAAAPAVRGMKQAHFTGSADMVAFGEADPTAAVRAQYEAELRTLREEANRRFVADRVNEGRVLACHEQKLVAFMGQLADAGMVAFASGESVPAQDWFKTWLSQMPPVVPMGMVNMGSEPEEAAFSDVSVPNGYSVDKAGADLHARASAYAREKNVSFADAVRAVSFSASR